MIAGMTVEDEEDALARFGDNGKAASTIRLRAAFKLTGFEHQKDLGEAAGEKKSTFNQMWVGNSYPNRNVMTYLYRRHRIDFDFMMIGDLSRLPHDVRGRIIPALREAAAEWDRDQTAPASASNTLPDQKSR